METFSALLALCAGNSPVSGEFPTQRPVTRSFDVFFDLHLIKLLSKHSRGWWFETPSCPLWRHRNALSTPYLANIPNSHTIRHDHRHGTSYIRQDAPQISFCRYWIWVTSAGLRFSSLRSGPSRATWWSFGGTTKSLVVCGIRRVFFTMVTLQQVVAGVQFSC